MIITHSSFSSRCHSVIKVPFSSKSNKNLSYMIHKIRARILPNREITIPGSNPEYNSVHTAILRALAGHILLAFSDVNRGLNSVQPYHNCLIFLTNKSTILEHFSLICMSFIKRMLL